MKKYFSSSLFILITLCTILSTSCRRNYKQTSQKSVNDLRKQAYLGDTPIPDRPPGPSASDNPGPSAPKKNPQIGQNPIPLPPDKGNGACPPGAGPEVPPSVEKIANKPIEVPEVPEPKLAEKPSPSPVPLPSASASPNPSPTSEKTLVDCRLNYERQFVNFSEMEAYAEKYEAEHPGSVCLQKDTSRRLGQFICPGGLCSGSIIGENHIMTNNHCTASGVQGCYMCMNNRSSMRNSPKRQDCHWCDQVEGSDSELDISIVRCRPKDNQGIGKRYGTLTFLDRRAKLDEDVWVAGHPLGGPLSVSFGKATYEPVIGHTIINGLKQSTWVKPSGTKLHTSATITQGFSGSAILVGNQIAALQHGKDVGWGKTNMSTHSDALLEWMKQRGLTRHLSPRPLVGTEAFLYRPFSPLLQDELFRTLIGPVQGVLEHASVLPQTQDF